MITPGSSIKSTVALDGSFFENATIFIVEHNDKGSIGFVTNKPYGKSLHELVEFSHSKPFPLMDGGPVDREHLYVLHKRPDLIEGGNPGPNAMHMGGNMEQVVNSINTKNLSEEEVQLFIGYCGWDAGELQVELEEGSWSLCAFQGPDPVQKIN